VLRILAPILMSGTLGWLVLRLFFRPRAVWLRPVFYLALGIPVGSGVFVLCSFLTFLFAGPGASSILVAFCVPAAIAVLVGYLQTTGRIGPPVTVTGGAVGRGSTVVIASVLLIVTCLAALLLVLGYFEDYPHGMTDAQLMWNGRARVMFRAGEFWRDVYLPDHFHPDYPLSLSILVFTGWSALGRETPTVPIALAVWFLFAGAAVTAVGVAIWKNLAWGLLASSLLLCSIGYVSWAAAQYADIPLSVFFVSSLVLLTLAYRDGNVHRPALALVGADAAFCGWIKNEGMPILIGLTLGLLLGCLLLRRLRQWPAEAGWFWIGAAPIVAVLQYSKSLTSGNDIVQGLANGTVSQKLLDADRWATIARRYGDAWLHAPGTVVPLVFILVFACALAGIRVERSLRLPLIAGVSAVCAVAAAHFAAYLITPNPLQWHLNTSVDRLALQLLPSVVFLSMALVRGEFLESRAEVQETKRETAAAHQ